MGWKPIRRGAGVLGLLMLAQAGAWGQLVPPIPGPTGQPRYVGPEPPPPPPPSFSTPCDHHPLIQGACRHLNYTLHDKFIGWAKYFNEPPLGASVASIHAVNIAKADPHRVMVYRSDFVGDSTDLSPSGAQRLSLLAARLNVWPGPILVEWSPDKRDLAELRRATVESLLRRAGIPLAANRVVLSPAPYPGGLGAESINNYDTLIDRNQRAARAYSLSPILEDPNFSSGGR
jgi:hypothetical protein